MSGVQPYEDVNTPQYNNITGGMGRGLHGIHMDYSSASYGMNGSTRGNCNYCHNQYVHETGFVTFSGMSPQSRQKISSVGLKGNVTGTGSGSNGIDITLMDGTATCTKACHKGTSATNSAQWANYTSSVARLTCNSCHADINGASGTESSLSGNHAGHLRDGAILPGGVAMNSANDAGCVNCHPDNTGQGKASIDDGSVKAYPHSSDGTNIPNPDNNVVLMNNISSAVKNGTSTTCVSKCHPRSNLVGIKWNSGGVSVCNACHNNGTQDSVIPGALVGGHTYHLFSLATSSLGTAAGCTDCHTNVSGMNDHQRADGSSGLTLPVGSGGAYINTDVNYNSGNDTCSPSAGGCHTGGEGSWSLM